jgi:hypothetical protein
MADCTKHHVVVDVVVGQQAVPHATDIGAGA